jgi:S1-C subfamily serine protease
VVVTEAATGKIHSFGTAFCIFSTDTKSYFVTNYHVVKEALVDAKITPPEINSNIRVIVKPQAFADRLVEGNVLIPPIPYYAFFDFWTWFKRTPPPELESDWDDWYKRQHEAESGRQGFVIQPSDNHDLAAFSINLGKIEPLIINYNRIEPGRAVGIAGYPVIHIGGAKEVSNILPSFHFGHVNSIGPKSTSVDYGRSAWPTRPAAPRSLFDGLVEYDATTDHGNSGGPLFESKTGLVVGVVEGGVSTKVVNNNLAISATELHQFLIRSKISHEYWRQGRFWGVPGEVASWRPSNN